MSAEAAHLSGIVAILFCALLMQSAQKCGLNVEINDSDDSQ